NRGVELTKDTHAEVAVQTLLGKRAVNLISGDFAGLPASPPQDQLLNDGDVIPVSRTTTPIDIVELNDISARLSQESDPVALNKFLKELTTITAGKQNQVRQVATGLTRVLKAVDSRKDQLADLITSLRILFTTLGEKRDTLISFIDRFDVVFQNLAARQQQIATLLQATDSASHETANLVSRNRRVLDSDLNLLHQVLEIVSRHQLDLAATIAYLEDAVQGYQSVGHTGGNCGQIDSFNCNFGAQNHWANIFVQSLGPAGVDALIGQCGAVDQFFDTLTGADCTLSPPGLHGTGIQLPNLPSPNGIGPLPPLLPPNFPNLPNLPGLPTGGTGGTGGINLPTPNLPTGAAASSAALPNSLGDLILSALDGWGGSR
ncbi:MAG TPA: MCE family protein, partial [Actinomycetota bacterium]